MFRVGVIAPIVDFYVEEASGAHGSLRLSRSKPRYSLRTLARALEYVSAASPLYGVQRAMMDGFSMSFLTLLKKEGQEILEKLMHKHLLGGKAIKVSVNYPHASFLVRFRELSAGLVNIPWRARSRNCGIFNCWIKHLFRSRLYECPEDLSPHILSCLTS